MLGSAVVTKKLKFFILILIFILLKSILVFEKFEVILFSKKELNLSVS